MTITNIIEIPNDDFPDIKPVKEKMDINIPGIIESVPHRNGFIWVLNGSGGSGKSSLLLNFFKSRKLYRNKFNNIYYICPMESFLSVEKHPFENHDKVYHELNMDVLSQIYEQLKAIKTDDKIDDETEKKEIEYNCVIIDDFADSLKDKHIQIYLNKMLIKARHLNTAFIFCLQSYYYFPKMLRKQINYITIFKPVNIEEWNSIAKELLHLNVDDGLKIYEYVFSDKYNHLDIDTKLNKIFKNFNELVLNNKNNIVDNNIHEKQETK